MARTILLADDSVTIQKVVELTFMDEDYEVEAVGDGTAAVARLESRCPDLLIADVHMPGADGYEVCRQAKARYPNLPVLLLVGTFEPFSASSAHEAGADDHLKKPFDAQDLQTQVEALIAKGAASAAPALVDPTPADPMASAPAGGEAEALPVEAVREVSPATDEWELASPEPEPAAPTNPDFDAMPSFSFDDAPTEAIANPTPPQPPAAPATESPFATALHKTAFPDTMPEFNPEPPQAAPEPPNPAFETVHMAHPAVPSPVGGTDGEVKEDNLPTQELEKPLAPAPDHESASDAATIEPMVTEPAAPPAHVAEPAVPEPAVPEPAVPEPAAPELAIAEATAVDVIASEPAADTTADASAEAAAEAAPAAHTNGAAMSDDDVDRVARRVVELLGEGVVREVAWEVVPDLAEVVIKERLRELEDEVG